LLSLTAEVTITMTTLVRIGFALGLVAVSACSHNDRTATGPSAGNEPAMQPASRSVSAAESIAEARCAREKRCENVGSDKKYSSYNDCMARIRDDWKGDLNARECRGGVNQSELNECLVAIRAEECNSPFDTLDRVAECTASQICIEDASDKR
jgi:hypothetical protein